MSNWILLDFFCASLTVGFFAYVIARNPPDHLRIVLPALCLALLVLVTGDIGTDLATTEFAYQICVLAFYSGISGSVVCWWIILVTTLRQHSNTDIQPLWQRLPPWIMGGLWICLITNPLHGYFITAHWGASNDYGVLWIANALGYWGMTITAGLTAFVAAQRSKVREEKIQAQMLAIGSLIPAIFSLLYHTKVTGLSVDLLVQSASLSTLCFFYAIYRGQLYGTSRLTLSEAFSLTEQIALVTDRSNKVVFFNASLEKVLPPPTLGANANAWLGRIFNQVESNPIDHSKGTSKTIYQYRSDPKQYYEVHRQMLERQFSSVGEIWLIQDATKHVQFTHSQIQAERYTALNTLAAGIAHHFNNHLAVILGYSDLISEKVDSETSHRYLQPLKVAVSRANNVATRLQSFTGDSIGQKDKIDANVFIESLISVLPKHLAENVNTELALNEQMICINQSSLIETVTALLVNAYEALTTERSPITIKTDRVLLSQSHLDNCTIHAAQPGYFVSLSIQDQGMGMDQDTLAELLNPFFTTRSFGRGLGLNGAVKLVQQHDAALDVDSQLQIGTTVTLYIPAAIS